jgi:uncharacterized membrane protein
MGLISVLNIFLIFLGISVVILTPSFRKGGSLTVEEGVAYSLLALGAVPLVLGTERAWCVVCPTLFERFVLQLGANACFLVAFGLQLRANAKKPDEELTSSADDPFEGNNRNLLWNDDEES